MLAAARLRKDSFYACRHDTDEYRRHDATREQLQTGNNGAAGYSRGLVWNHSDRRGPNPL